MKIFSLLPPPQTTTAETQRQSKLADAAHQFEGIFLQELLKPLQSGSEGLSDDSSDGSADTLRSYGTEAVAKAISARGGFGIARQIIRQLGKSGDVQEDNPQNLTTS